MTGVPHVRPPSVDLVIIWCWKHTVGSEKSSSTSNASTTVPRLTSKASQGSQLIVLSRLGRSAIVQVSPPSNEVATWMVWYGHGLFSEAVTMWSGSFGSTAIEGSSVVLPYSSGQSRDTFLASVGSVTHSNPERRAE